MRRITASEVEVVRLRRRYDVIDALVPWIGRAICLAALWIPARGLEPMVEDVAGKTTDVNIVISVTLAASLTTAIGWARERSKNKKQKKEIERLRERLSTYEKLHLAGSQRER